MSRIKRINFTKKDLSNQIAKKTGLPNFYILKQTKLKLKILVLLGLYKKKKG